MDGAVKLGRLIREARMGSGLSQRELAEAAGLSLGAVRDLEQGRSSHPRARSLDAIAAVLGLSEADRARLRQHAARPVKEPAEPSGPVRIGVLGPLTVLRASGPVDLGYGRHRAVLARLALTPGHPVSREELIEVVWGGGAPASAANVLQTHVSRLRRILGPELISRTAGGYRLQVTADHLDLVAYRARLAAWRQVSASDPQRGFDLLSEALDMWRGAHSGAEDVAELQGHPMVTALAEELIEATIELARLGQVLRRLPEVLPRLRRLTTRHHWHEALHARLVVALAAGGQQAAALEAYEQVKQRLAEELGIDPGAELVAARQAVLEGRWESAAPGDRLPTPWQAPAPPPDFTGRAEQLSRLERLLRSARRRRPDAPLVTCVVSGMPGVGKTSLALRAAQTVRDDFPDGQLYLDLRGADQRPLGEDEALARLLRGLGVPGRRIPADAGEASALYRSLLAGRRLLILLDNARNAAQIRPLLPGPGASAVLVTSRHHCADLPGAVHVDLPVLTAGEAVAMLNAKRAAGVDGAAVAALAEACGRLPVALRVIASRLGGRPGRTAQEVLTRLTEALAGADGEDAAVTATFDLSYRELAAEPARVFRWAALVPGTTFTAPAVAALLAAEADTTERVLDALVDENVLEAAGDSRYRFHDLLRRYAHERIAERPPAERRTALGRLAGWYLTRTAAAIRLVYPAMVRLPTDVDGEPMCFPDVTAAWGWLDAEIGNLVALVQTLATGEHRALAWQLADQLRGYFFVRREVVSWLACGHAGLTAAEAAGDLRAQAAMHQTIGQAYWSIGRHRAALEAYRRGLDAARGGGWLIGATYLLHNLGLVHAELGMVDEARELYLHVLDAGTGREFAHIRAVTLNDLGVMCTEQGRLPEAVRHLRAAMEINQEAARLPSAIANCSNLGMALRQLGEFDAAHENFEKALDYYREAGSASGQMAVLDELSHLYQQRGEWHAAVGAATDAYRLAEELSDQRSLAGVLNTLGAALLGSRAVSVAQERFQAALEISRTGGYRYYEAQARIGVADALLMAGDAGEAYAAAEVALEIARRADYRILAGAALATMAKAAPAREEEQRTGHAPGVAVLR